MRGLCHVGADSGYPHSPGAVMSRLSENNGSLSSCAGYAKLNQMSDGRALTRQAMRRKTSDRSCRSYTKRVSVCALRFDLVKRYGRFV